MFDATHAGMIYADDHRGTMKAIDRMSVEICVLIMKSRSTERPLVKEPTPYTRTIFDLLMAGF